MCSHGPPLPTCSCYPKAHDKVIIPKYRIVNVQFHKARVGALVYTGIALIIIAIILFATIKDEEDMDDEEDSGGQVGGGVICLLAGIFALVYPFLCKSYTISLEIRSKGGVGNSAFGKWNINSKTEWLLLNTTEKPDEDLIMDYVYGTVSSGMDDFHTLSHLLDDSMVGEVRPRSVMGAVGKA